MVRIIYFKELSYQIKSIKYFISCSLIIVLMLICAFSNSSKFINEINDYNEIQKYNRDLISYDKYNLENVIANARGNEKSSNNLCDFAFLELKLEKRPTSLLFISNGNETDIPNGIQLSSFRVSNFKYFKNLNNSIHQLIEIDWVTILSLFISFIVIVLSYDSVSGEKINGTLKLIASYRINKWEIIFAKYLSILTLILVPFIIGIILNFIVFTFSNLPLNYIDLIKIILFTFFAFSFISFQIILCLFVSTITSKPNISLLYCIFIWILLVLIIPNSSWILSNYKKVSTIEETDKIEKAKISNLKANWSWDSRWLKKEPNKRLYELEKSYNDAEFIHEDIWNKYRNSVFEQTELAINISKVSPFFNFKVIADKISDRSYFSYKHFYNQIQNYHDILNNFIKSSDQMDKTSHHLIFNHKYLTKSFMSNETIKIQQVPLFEYKPITINQLFFDSRWEILSLFLWNLICFISAFVAFIKYDVR